MPRIHEGNRQKKRGIFSLSTPFQKGQGEMSFTDNDMPHAQPAMGQQQQSATENILIAPRKEDMDIEVHEHHEAGMSQLTLEGGTQFYSGAVDDDMNRVWDDMEDTQELNDGKEVGGLIGSESNGENAGLDVQEQTNIKNQKTIGELMDDSVTTIGDKDDIDKESIDLLQDDDDSAPKTKTDSLQDDLDAARNGCTPKNSKVVRKKLPEFSPATMTLDRLDALGSQQGGAELSLNLLTKADDTNDPKKKDEVVRDVAPKSPDDNTVIGTQVEKRNNSHGGVSFRLLNEAKERQTTVNSNELLAVARGQPTKSNTDAQAEKKKEEVEDRLDALTDQSCLHSKPQKGRQPSAARPSKQGLSADDEDKLHLQDDSSESSSNNNDSSSDSFMKEHKAPVQAAYTKEIQSVSADLAKRQCLHELNEYFMSTQNSSEYARKNQNSNDYPTPPQMPFCIACKNPSTQLPHHGLCPKHADFFVSGSYEILDLLVDGNILQCEACMFHFDNGRPNKHLEHMAGCEKGGKKKEVNHSGATGADHKKGRFDYRTVSLKDASASGCQKCQRELRTGTKSDLSHDKCCPRRRGNLLKGKSIVQASCIATLEDAASSGCKKCQYELATGKKDLVNHRYHNDNCPRKGCRVRGRNDSNTPAANEQSRLSDETRSSKTPKFDVGTVVFVESRTWTRINKPGGVARVTHVHLPMRNGFSDCIKYDVAYVIETRKERMIEERFITLHHDYISPSKDHTLARPFDVIDSSESEDEKSQPEENEIASPIRTNDNKTTDDGNEFYLSSAEKRDECGNPLSEYELLRLRNIKRNEARLAKLGLVASGQEKSKPKDKAAKNPRNDNEKKAVASSEKRTIVTRKAKSDQSETVASAKVPKRPNDEPNKSKKRKDNNEATTASKKTKSSSGETVKQQPKKSDQDSLVRGAKLGCNKCTLEWRTEKKDSLSGHDQCCPWYTIEATQQASRRKAANAKFIERTPPPFGRPSNESIMVTAERGNENVAARSITPSPALLAPGSSQPLPPVITEFTSQADTNNDLYVPSGSKWLSCPNPWGKIGHEEGDIVIISPFESMNAHDLISTFHQDPNGCPPKRFTCKPLAKHSSYLKSHRSPDRGGYTVLRLTRDRAGLIPWGFTVRCHEFGGACLVDNVEPLSPADRARDIMGWEDTSASSIGLKIHDMVISINGKAVGGMTEPEFQIELEVCGPEIMLVVSRLDISGEDFEMGGQDDNPLGVMAMDWNEVGAVTPSCQKKVSFGEDGKQSHFLFNGMTTQTQHTLNAPSSAVDEHISTQKQASVSTNGQLKKSAHKSARTDSSKVQQKRIRLDALNDDSDIESIAKHTSSTTKGDGAVSIKKNTSMSINESQALLQYRKPDPEQSNDSADHAKLSVHARHNSHREESKNHKECIQLEREQEEASFDDEEDEDDENPWLGCVCGKTHPSPIPVFWVQCETCDAWYNASPECIGFDAARAEHIATWSCWSCCPPIAGLEK